MTARETGAVEPDNRPANCRFRLQDEGKPCPRSGCKACGATVATGLGNKCSRPQPTPSATGEIVERLASTWIDFLDHNPDDLTSPEDLPDHALMTGAQFEKYALAAVEPLIEQQAATIAERDAEITRLNELALSGVNMGVATGLKLAADWHRQRHHDTPDAFEMELHEVSEKAILAMLHGSKEAARATLERTRGQ